MSLRGKSKCTVSLFFYEKAPLSSVPLFKGKRGSRLLPAIRDPPQPRHGGELNLHFDLVDELERDRPFRGRRPRTRVSCWIVMMRSF